MEGTPTWSREGHWEGNGGADCLVCAGRDKKGTGTGGKSGQESSSLGRD